MQRYKFISHIAILAIEIMNDNNENVIKIFLDAFITKAKFKAVDIEKYSAKNNAE